MLIPPDRIRELKRLYGRFHRPEYLRIDPLVVVRRFAGDPRNAEVVGCIASALSYGRVERIIHTVETVLSLMDGDPYAFVNETTFREKSKRFAGVVHRFNTGNDIALLCEAIKQVVAGNGSLGSCFGEMYQRESSFKGALGLFSAELKQCGHAASRGSHPYFDYLLPSPESGSACKRLCMYVRWMVRPDDGIDLGIWKDLVPASALVIPVDTHVLTIAQEMGLTERKQADWRAAEEITASLRCACSTDPVKYDFSLCRAGMTALRKE